MKLQKTTPRRILPAHLTPADVSLLEEKCSLSLPPDAILQELLVCFIDYVHPQLPFMDLQQFCGNVREMVLSGKFSLFVMNAVLAVAFPHLDERAVSESGFQHAREASRVYHSKAEVVAP